MARRRQIHAARSIFDWTIETIFLTSCKPLSAKEKLIPRQTAAYHIAASLLALIVWWLEHDMPYPTDKMGQVYNPLIIRATLTAR